MSVFFAYKNHFNQRCLQRMHIDQVRGLLGQDEMEQVRTGFQHGSCRSNWKDRTEIDV